MRSPDVSDSVAADRPVVCVASSASASSTTTSWLGGERPGRRDAGDAAADDDDSESVRHRRRAHVAAAAPTGASRRRSVEHRAHVPPRGPLRGVGVAGLDRRQDVDVLVPADEAATIDQQGEDELGLGAQRFDGRPEVAVAGGPLDRQVELTVGVGGVDRVVGGGGIAPGFEPAPHLVELLRCPPARCELGGERLEHAAQLEQLDGAVDVERGDVGAAARRDLDETGVLEHPDRLTNGVARDAELLGETVLEQALTRLQLAAADHLADLVGDDLAQRAVCISEPARR